MKLNELSKKFLNYGITIIILFCIWGLINHFFLDKPFFIPIIIGFTIGIILILTGRFIKRIE
ncbi:hypothetical protein CD114_06850 [Mammaliicoccus sciuri]|nr:hypothetical protein CD114_06850 [Mammaliicoccus sciuri]